MNKSPAENSPLASEDLFQSFMASSPAAAWIVDQQERIRYLSPGYYRTFGVEGESLTGQAVRDIYEPALADIYLENNRKVLREGRALEIVESGKRKDGAMGQFLAVKFPIVTSDGNSMVGGIAIDITEFKRAEAERDRLFSLSLDMLCVGSVLDGRLLQVNPAWTRCLGWSAEELTSQGSLNFVHPDDHAASLETRERLRRGEPVRDFENRYRCKDGSYRWLSWSSYPLVELQQVFAVVRDVTDRKHAEKAIVESERKFRALFDRANDAFYILKDGRFVDFNLKGAQFFGVDREELLGRTPYDFSPALQPDGQSSREKALDIIRKVEGGEPQTFEWMQCRPDGTTVFADVSASHLELHGQIYIQAIARDTTERKQLERERQRMTRQMEALLESAGEGILGIDTEGRCTFLNRAGSKMLQRSPEEVLGQNMHHLVHHHHADHSLYLPEECPILRSINQGEGFQGTNEVFWRADGTSFPIEYCSRPTHENGVVSGAVVIFSDMTERLCAKEQIAEQAAFMDQARDAIVARTPEGKLVFWNQGAERLYGWKREEVLGRNVGELLYQDPTKYAEVSSQLLARGEWSGELRHRTKDRRELVVESRWTLIRDRDGRPKSVLAINSDLTERKKIEAQFLRAQRMESIGTLAGGIAHDLNNILAPIVMSIDLLKSVSEHPQAGKILETIEISAKRGASIVRQVLSFARGLEGERIEVQPKHLLKDLEQIISDTFPKDIRLHFSVPSETWTILGDPTQIHQILLNLCVNARDAMPNGGNLSVEVENCDLDEHYAAMNLEAKAGHYVRIGVTDTGTGIPHDILDKIFEPFFTTKDVNKGTGLGLSTVMAIVKSHEGIINVYSERGRGATFNVYLPAMAGSPETRKEQSEHASLPRGNGEIILVVDDEASVLTVTGQTLQAFGYRVLTASDGAEAVAQYARHQHEISVVLTDMMMPVLDGPAMIHALMRLNPEVKIIGASGLAAGGEGGRLALAGVKHFLTKPYTAGALLRTLRAILSDNRTE